ncbi:MAG: RDD family protein [Acidimicrobiia bacterium]
MAERRDTDAFLAPTFGQRLGGRGLDALVLLPVLFLFTVSLNGATYRIAWFIVIAAYDIGGVAIWGQTIGKRLLGTKVVNITDDPLRPWQAVIRFLTFGVPALIFTAIGLRVGADLWVLIVLVPVLRPPWHRGLHDVAARTIVVPITTELGGIR